MITKQRLNWNTIFFISVFHIGAAYALSLFSWRLLAMAVAMRVVTCFGVGIGFHRYLTHSGFKTPKIIRYVLATMGCLSLQGSPLRWIARHRLHHQFTDKPQDFHSPNDGLFWAHMGWMLVKTPYSDSQELLNTYTPDLLKDPYFRFLDKYWYLPIVILSVLLYAFFGYAAVLWVVVLQTVVGWHFTWSVNSASHRWGSRRYETNDKSTNNWIVALLTLGDWHNNHHDNPRSAKHGRSWYQIDVNWYIICILKYMRLAKDVKSAAA